MSSATATGVQQGFTHKPALDGLRAVAVGSVMAFHFGATWAEGGFLGVDTFFVLSGYLITSLLLTEWGRTGTLRFSTFWARRARRLLPALLLALAGVAVWASVVAQTDQLDSIRADSLSTLFYGANWHFIQAGESYFDLFREPSPLRHAWSLAIEEQFYLLWPLITFGLLRLGRGKPRVLGWFCAGGIALSAFFLAHLFNPDNPNRAYYGTDTRASQLLIGALLAIFLLKWSPTTKTQSRAVQAAGFAGAAFCLWTFTAARDFDSWMYYGGFIGFAVATAAVIAAIVQEDRTPLRFVLTLRPVRWIGEISYGLYLWHWPVLIVINEKRTGLDGASLGLLRLGVTVGAAALSYYFVELPIRRGEVFRKWRALVAAPTGFAIASILLVATTAGATKPPAFLAGGDDEQANVVEVEPPTTVPTTAPVAAPPLPGPWLMIGDSVAHSLGGALQLATAERGITTYVRTRPGCGLVTALPVQDNGRPVPWGQGCVNGTTRYLNNAVEKTGAKIVLWLSNWEASTHSYHGRVLKLGTPEGDEAMFGEIEFSIGRITAHGARVVLLTNAPQSPENDIGIVPGEDFANQVDALNNVFRRVALAHPGTVTFVDLAAIVCPTGPPCPAVVDGVAIRPRDGLHFEGNGGFYVAPLLVEAIIASLQGASSADG